jgi:hypothetical protein
LTFACWISNGPQRRTPILWPPGVAFSKPDREWTSWRLSHLHFAGFLTDVVYYGNKCVAARKITTHKTRHFYKARGLRLRLNKQAGRTTTTKNNRKQRPKNDFLDRVDLRRAHAALLRISPTPVLPPERPKKTRDSAATRSISRFVLLIFHKPNWFVDCGWVIKFVLCCRKKMGAPRFYNLLSGNTRRRGSPRRVHLSIANFFGICTRKALADPVLLNYVTHSSNSAVIIR